LRGVWGAEKIGACEDKRHWLVLYKSEAIVIQKSTTYNILNILIIGSYRGTTYILNKRGRIAEP
jgi:hypothetical protein